MRFATTWALFLLLPLPAAAQTLSPSTVGYPPYTTFENGSFDNVNMTNLNQTFSIPIVSYVNRGKPFTFNITYNSLIYQRFGNLWGPRYSGSRLSNFQLQNYGWSLQNAIGELNYNKTTDYCPDNSSWYEYNNFIFTDVNGTEHSFNLDFTAGARCPTGITNVNTGYATDGSGYYASSFNVYSPAGDIVSAAGQSTDSNGNIVKVTAVALNEDDWTDTSGHVVLKVVATPSWNNPSYILYQYLDSNGNFQSAQLNMGAFNIQTALGCAGVTEFTSYAPIYLPTSFTLLNGRSYNFSYQQTPGNPSASTGILQQVTLPTGGSYTYTGQTPNCADGTLLNLARGINDGVSSQVFSYARTVNGANSQVTVTPPVMPWDSSANPTVYTFNNGLQASKTDYQGAPVLRSSNTTYSAQMPPFTVTSTTNLSGVTSQTATDYDFFGNITGRREFSFGSGAPGPIARTINTSYLTGPAYTANNLVNRPTQQLIYDSTNALKYKQVIAYDGSGLVCVSGLSTHDDSGHGCSFLARGNPTSVTTYANAAASAGPVTKNITYDSLGNLRTADADCCVTQTFAFSSATQYIQPDSVTSGSGPTLTKSFTYNAANLPATSTDENGQISHYTYDSLFRLTDLQRPDNAHITTTYNDSGHSYSVSTPVQGSDRNVETKAYDGLGRFTRDTISDVNGTAYSISDTQYDALNRVYKQSNPYTGSPQFWTENDFDSLSRPVKTIHPDGSIETNVYSNNITTYTDGAGKQKQYVADALGRTVTVNEPDVNNGNALTIATNYGYTVNDVLSSVSQGAQSRSYLYDDAGRLTSTTNPESGNVALVPNNFGLVTQKTDARGVITTFSYNGLNQLSGISYNVGSTGVAATPAVSFTYGSTPAQFNNGRLITMTDGPGTESYTYDLLGRTTSLARKVNNVTYTSQYGYNLASELTNLSYPSNKSVVQGYDKIGRLNLVIAGDNSVTYANNFSYDAAAHLTGFTNSNGVIATYGFNPQNLQLATLGYATNTQTFYSVSYGYAQNGGNNGQITRIVDNFQPGRSLTYSYDALNRLKTAVTDGSTSFAKWGLSWTYDRYGNRTAQTVTAGSAPSNSLGISANTNEIVGTTYDANGNMLNEPGLGGAYTYDAENRMLSAVISAHPVGTYTYSGVNLRTTRNVNGTLTTYIYNGNNVIAEYLNNASPQFPGREYIYAGNKLIGTTSGTDLKYYHQDHQSIRLITDVNAAKVDDRGHYPYGELWYDNGSFSTKFVFTNYKRDPDESNNDYAINRFYSNRLGRFMQSDKLGGAYTNPQSFNLFAYVANDPVNRLDPLGLFLNDPCAGNDFCVTVNADPPPDIGFVDPFAGAGLIPFDPGNLGGTFINRRPIRGPSLPTTKRRNFIARVQCANEFANNHSLAALVGAQNTFLGKAVGGNIGAAFGETLVAVADGSNFNPVSGGASIVIGGAVPGSPIGGPGIKGAAGIAQDAVVKTGVSTAYNYFRGIGNTPLRLFASGSQIAAEDAAQLSLGTLENVATGVGIAKTTIDIGVYLYGYSQCQ